MVVFFVKCGIGNSFGILLSMMSVLLFKLISFNYFGHTDWLKLTLAFHFMQKIIMCKIIPWEIKIFFWHSFELKLSCVCMTFT
jgi:hypothetical protein